MLVSHTLYKVDLVSKTPLTAEEIAELNRLSTLVDDEDHYRLLDVGRSSEASIVQQAYYTLSRKWHPDAFFRRDVGEYGTIIDKIFMGLTEAYQILSDPKKKQIYDRKHTTTVSSQSSTDTESSNTSSVRAKRHRKGRRRRERERQRAQQETSSEPKQSIKEKLRRQRQKQIIGRVNSSIEEQKQKAHENFEQGMLDYREGRVMQAATALHFACELDPENQQYKEHFRVIRKEARALKAEEFIAAAENAENFSNYGRAIEQYRKAVSYECEDAAPYARLAYLVSRLDPDPREIIHLLQIAVQKDPDNAEYHCLLGKAYFRQGMSLNAKREFQAALAIQKNYQRAVEGLSVL